MTWELETVALVVEAATVLTRMVPLAISRLVVVDSLGFLRGCSQEVVEQMESGVKDAEEEMGMDVEDVCCCWPASNSES